MAFSGAPTRGPFFSSRISACRAGTPCTDKREPPRRHERLGALIDEAGIDQPVGDELAQILRRARLHAGGNFLGEQFEQKVGHWASANPSPSPGGEGRRAKRAGVG